MILLFENITGKTCPYTISDSRWFPHGTEDFLLKATAKVNVSRRNSETVLLKGSLDGQYSVACDRCKEQVKGNLYSEFEYLVTTRKEQALGLRDVECSEEDVITLYLEESEIDVDEILREQTYLAMPLKTLCSENCKGICTGCGVSLNSEACCCPFDKNSSAFAVLKKLTTS
jgi:uncharacterized protein